MFCCFVIRCCGTYRSLVQCGLAWLSFLGLGPVQKRAGYVVGNVDAAWVWVKVTGNKVLQAGGHGASRRGFSDVDDELIISLISSLMDRIDEWSHACLQGSWAAGAHE